MVGEETSKTLHTTSVSIDILQAIEEMDGARVTELAEHLNTPKSTVHGHLATLQSRQFVTKRGDSYHLGPELLRLGNTVRTHRLEFVLARQFTQQLYEETGFRSVFATEMNGRATILYTASGDKSGWAHEEPGNQLYLHNTSLGKAILALMPPRKLEAVVERWGLPEETEHTITQKSALRSELETIREQGYACNYEENIQGLCGIGTAAVAQSGTPIGSFSITGPKKSFTDPNKEHQLADSVIEVTEKYELEINLS